MNIRKLKLILCDAVIIGVAYLMTALLFSTPISSIQMNKDWLFIKGTVFLVCILTVRLLLGNYFSVWRYANVESYLHLIFSDIISYGITILLSHFVPFLNPSFAFTTISAMLIIIGTLMSRFVYQYLYAHQNQLAESKDSLLVNQSNDNTPPTAEQHKINIAIVGAGNIGAALAQELLRNPRAHYTPYCFIDTDKSKAGSSIHGIKIYLADQTILDRLKDMPVQEIVIALPDITPQRKQELYAIYKKTGCKVKLYDYPLEENNDEPNRKRTLREFKIEELLFRDPIVVNGALAKQYYTGKTILVTGGGGSIGSELCRQIAKLSPKKLIIVDIYENNAYEIQQELIRKYGKALDLEVLIASVRDVARLDEIFDTFRPDIVFHAAAHKHVPLMENSACEALKNNVLGTYNTANMAEKYSVKKFLLISTDKAVNPTNVMGASKRLCEMVIQCRKDSRTEFTAVRFGNVLGSNGSVIPLFKKQIEAGGPVTLTDRRIIRYFMTIPEAVGLVMETGAMAHNGELFVLDMGKPIKILDLAENMIRLFGLKPYEDIDIVEIGLRPGEKLYEELLMKTEELDKTPNKMIFIERDKPLSRKAVEDKLCILREAVKDGSYEAVLSAIRTTVPTYHSPDEVNQASENAEEMKLSEEKITVCT